MDIAQPARLGEAWAGNIYGTNTGKVFLKLTGEPKELVGILRLADDQLGVSIFDARGQFDGETLTLNGRVREAPEGTVFGEISAVAKLQQNGSLSGEWESTIGTGGVLILYPHIGSRLVSADVGPEQIYTVSRELGTLVLYRDDVIQLIRLLERDFRNARVTVTYFDRGTEITRYAADFEAHLTQLEKLQAIKLSARMADASGIDRIATIDVGQMYNRVTVQGPEVSWVLGEAESLTSHLRRREKRLSTRIGKYHVGLNQLVGLGALMVMPELALRERVLFIVAVVIFLAVAERLKRKLIPNLSLHLNRPTPSFLSQAWPSILSLLISTVAGVASAVIYKWLGGEF